MACILQCVGLHRSGNRYDASDGDSERLAYNEQVGRMRKYEYPMLKGKIFLAHALYTLLSSVGLTYLDHGGTTLAPKSLLHTFSNEMQKTLLANPHSDASNPSATAVMVEETRLQVLEMFNADPEHFDIIFTANATGSIKLVAEGLSGFPEGFDYYYHRNSHTSLVGVRELARYNNCFVSNEEVEKWLVDGENDSGEGSSQRPVLFAYPAQS